MSFPKVIMFIADARPNFDEETAAMNLAPLQVVFRNVKFYAEADALENVDAWFGDLTPQRYKDKYPSAETAMQVYMEKRKGEHDAKLREAALAQEKAAIASEDQAKAAAAAAELTMTQAAQSAAKANAGVEAAQAQVAKAAAAKDAKATTGQVTEAAKKAAASWAPNPPE
jgi:hypothetical protein